MLMLLLTMGVSSCKKNIYCHCYATIADEEVTSLGQDIDISNLTEEQVEEIAARYQYNLYIMEDGTCNDKAREFSGWRQVTCKEAKTKDEDTWEWLMSLFSNNNNNNNNNNSNNNH